MPSVVSRFTLVLNWILITSVYSLAQGLTDAEQFSKKAFQFYLKSQWDSAEFYYFKSANTYERSGNIVESLNEGLKLVDLFIAQNSIELVKSTVDSLFTLVPEKDSLYDDVRSQLYWKLGTYHEMISSLNEAHKNTELAISMQESIGDYNRTILAEMYKDLGILHQRDRDYSSALKYYKKSFRLRKVDQDPLAMANIHNSLAVAYFYLGEFSIALKEYQMCLNYYKTINSKHPKIAVAYNNIAFTHMKIQDYDSSILYHRKALRIRLNTLPENHPQVISSYNGMGIVYTVNEQYDSAEFYFKKCVQLLESYNSDDFNYFLSRVVYNICKLNFRRERFSESLEYITKAINLNLPAKELSDSTFYEIRNVADLVDLMQFKVSIMTRLYDKYQRQSDLEIGLDAF
ncbi:MAG: tetratricopeptide repeat protein, partial [Patescibacteria group bacterium]